MKRPVIKDGHIAKYVIDLERQLENFNPDKTNVMLYLGVKKQIDNIAAILNQDEVEVPAPTADDPEATKTVSIMSMETLSDKDDKFMDRFQKILDKFQDHIKNLKAAHEDINPTILSEAEKEAKKESGSVYEQALNVK